MRRSNTEYLTMLFGFIAILLGAFYLLQDNLSKIVSYMSSHVSLPYVQLPPINLDWYFKLDLPSQIIMAFIFVLLAATAIGCVGLFIAYKRVSGRS